MNLNLKFLVQIFIGLSVGGLGRYTEYLHLSVKHSVMGWSWISASVAGELVKTTEIMNAEK